MSRGEPSIVHRQIRTLFDAGAVGGLTDGQLLEVFARRRDEVGESAFTALVKRHGPMVLGVCRRILRDADDSEDAFQATFLVLAHKADAVRVSDSLGRWLYGVSRRVALQVRTSALRRSSRETADAERAAVPPPDREREELLAALDEEIARLPEKYRSAIILCDLGGTNHAEAARQLGCPVGTVESRLSRGRELLRTRLTRRGLAPAALASAGALASRSAMAALPAVLVEATARASLEVAAGRGLKSGAVAASVAALTERVLKVMAMSRLKIGVFGLLAAGALAVGAAILASTVRRSPVTEDSGPPPMSSLPFAESKVPESERVKIRLLPVQPGDLLRIEVLEALPGRPLTGIRRVRPDGTISLGFYGDLYVAGLNRDEIKAKLVEHLQVYLQDEVLGLIEEDENGKWRRVKPVDSDRVFVEDHVNQEGEPERHVDALERKMERSLQSMEERMDQLLLTARSLQPGPNTTPPPQAAELGEDPTSRGAPFAAREAQDPNPPEPSRNTPFPEEATPSARPTTKPETSNEATQDARLDAIERKLDRILQKLEGSQHAPRE